MRFLIIVLLCLITGIKAEGQDTDDPGQEANKPSILEEVIIANNAVKMPLGRILLARKASQYCAVKFTEAWGGKTKEDFFSNYESYCQGDGTGDFTNKNVQFIKEQLVMRQIVGFHPFYYPVSRQNKEIKCGSFRLFWHRGVVYFYYEGRQKPGDYGIEFAPTKWKDIFQVNVFDERLKWYRYDEKRMRTSIPIDQLWEDEEEQK